MFAVGRLALALVEAEADDRGDKDDEDHDVQTTHPNPPWMVLRLPDTPSRAAKAPIVLHVCADRQRFSATAEYRGTLTRNGLVAVAHAGSTLPCRKPSEDPVGRGVDGRRPAPAGLHDTGGRADGAGTASTRRPCAPLPGGRPGRLHVVPSLG